MIDIKDKHNCCGCEACSSICPKKCITMKEAFDGFLYPQVDKNQCINCHLCEKVCPFLNNNREKSECNNSELIANRIEQSISNIGCYACFNNDIQIRNNSTSGGFFTALADYVLKNGGYVCGAIFNEFFAIEHMMTNKKDDVSKMRGSKYVQSKLNGIFTKIKKQLEENYYVLFSGTPCQVEGLHRFLGREYEKLITVDFVCHGVGSPKYWKKYLEYIKEHCHSKIVDIKFREKTYGYNSSCMAVYFENGKAFHKGHDDDKYLLPFFSDYILRSSCYECKVKKLNHVADFTMGDFWNSSKLDTKFQEANGATLLLIHSNKGNKLFNDICKQLTYVAISLKDGLIVNSGKNMSMLLDSTKEPKNRTEFFNDLEKMEIRKLLNKHIPLSMKRKIAYTIKPILYKLGVLEKMKRLIK